MGAVAPKTKTKGVPTGRRDKDDNYEQQQLEKTQSWRFRGNIRIISRFRCDINEICFYSGIICSVEW